MEHKITQKNHKYSIISTVEKNQVPFLFGIVSKAQCIPNYEKFLDKWIRGSQLRGRLGTAYVTYVALSPFFKHYAREDLVVLG